MKLPTVDESVMDAIEARTKCLQGVLEDAYCDLKIRIRNLEAENADLKRELKVADRAIINQHNELKAAMEKY